MGQRVKHLDIDDEMEKVLKASVIERVNQTEAFMLRLPHQLDRKLYERINKIIDAEGGKWIRQTKVHLFTHDPRERLGLALEAGQLDVLNDGWFPTPRSIVEQMLDTAPWEGGDILEPSAGEGAIAQAIRERWEMAELYLLCIELHQLRGRFLQAAGPNTLQADFLMVNLPPVFSRIYMNPPFEQGQDIDHVFRAYGLLASGGWLVAIMSEGPFFREDAKGRMFRNFLLVNDGQSEPLPKAAFRESGTDVNTRLVWITKA